MAWTERLSVFADVASEVVASLVFKYEKAHPRTKWKIVVIFLQAYEKERKKKKTQRTKIIIINGDFCSAISWLDKKLGELRG